MRVVTTREELAKQVALHRNSGKVIGFVPTMGALHEGHLSLVNEAAGQSDVVVVSVFVNPTQFNNADDLKNYPRTLEQDILQLEKTPCQLLFAPSVSEIYPEPDNRRFEFGELEKVMEGKFRPGHFNGVAQVVSRLFEMVTPDKAFFGQKDFQQVAIIRSLVKMINSPVKIISCPIIRERDGLAMSSRNQLLTPEHRKNAPIIWETLSNSRNFVDSMSVRAVVDTVIQTINNHPLFEVEYFQIVDGYTLQPIENWDEADYVVGCITVYAGKIRLIDNIEYKK